MYVLIVNNDSTFKKIKCNIFSKFFQNKGEIIDITDYKSIDFDEYTLYYQNDESKYFFFHMNFSKKI